MAIEPITALVPGLQPAGRAPAQDVDSEFEAVLLQSMLKSHCIDQHFTAHFSTFDSYLPADMSRRPVLTSPAQNEPHVPDAAVESTTVTDQGSDDFVQAIWPYAKQAASILGLDPKLLVAQAVLETGWGQSIIKGTNNLFNIKATGNAPAVQTNTTEYITDTPVNMLASFKKYPSVEHSFHDYVALMQGARYKTAMENSQNPERYVHALQDAGYATDPEYARKILSVYHGEELQRVFAKL